MKQSRIIVLNGSYTLQFGNDNGVWQDVATYHTDKNDRILDYILFEIHEKVNQGYVFMGMVEGV